MYHQTRKYILNHLKIKKMGSKKSKKSVVVIETPEVENQTLSNIEAEISDRYVEDEVHFDVSEENDMSLSDAPLENSEIVNEEIVSENSNENIQDVSKTIVAENTTDDNSENPVYKLPKPRAVKNSEIILVAYTSTYQWYNLFGKYIANGAKLNLKKGKFKEKDGSFVLDTENNKIPMGHNFRPRTEKYDIAAHVKYLEMPWHPEYTPKNHDCYVVVGAENLAQLKQNIADFLTENPSDYWKAIVAKCFVPVSINEDGTEGTIVYQLPVIADVISDELHDAAVDATKSPVLEEEMA